MQASSPAIISILPDLLPYIPQVQIDKTSRFKYIYISIYLKKKSFNASTDSLFLIRGTKKHSYHADIFDAFKQELKLFPCVLQTNSEEPQKDLFKTVKMEVIGGGWLEWFEDNKKLKIYGESQAFGPCDHNKTRDILLKNMKEFKPEDIIVLDDD